MKATSDGTSVHSPYDPTGGAALNPLDPLLALPWPTDVELVLSDKDRAAPSLAAAQAAGWLPRWEGL